MFVTLLMKITNSAYNRCRRFTQVNCQTLLFISFDDCYFYNF